MGEEARAGTRESTVRALERIRAKPVNETRQGVSVDRAELEASIPGTYTPTVLVLPPHLSDAVKLAVLDLDPADEAVRGKTLYWSERTVPCSPSRSSSPLSGVRHPEVTVSDNCRSASWSQRDGPHSVGCESLPWMIGYLEAKFDR